MPKSRRQSVPIATDHGPTRMHLVTDRLPVPVHKIPETAKCSGVTARRGVSGRTADHIATMRASVTTSPAPRSEGSPSMCRGRELGYLARAVPPDNGNARSLSNLPTDTSLRPPVVVDSIWPVLARLGADDYLRLFPVLILRGGAEREARDYRHGPVYPDCILRPPIGQYPRFGNFPLQKTMLCQNRTN